MVFHPPLQLPMNNSDHKINSASVNGNIGSIRLFIRKEKLLMAFFE